MVKISNPPSLPPGSLKLTAGANVVAGHNVPSVSAQLPTLMERNPVSGHDTLVGPGWGPGAPLLQVLG